MPYLLVSACWIIFAASLIHFVSTDRKFHTIVRDDRYYLMALILLGVVAAGCGYIWPFYGIEYEDAFEYTYSGILLAYQLPPRTESLNSICVSGSLEHCRSFMTLAHPIGLAVLVSWLPFRMRWWNHSAQISFHACFDSYRPSHFFGESAMAEFAVSSWYFRWLTLLDPIIFCSMAYGSR